MKRDMDLIRNVLLWVEDKTDEFNFEEVAIDGVDEATVYGHVQMLVNAGYVEGTDVTTMGIGYRKILPQRLTWRGHEFLEATRNDTVWAQVKAKVAEHGGSAPFELLKQLADGYLKQKFGLDK